MDDSCARILVVLPTWVGDAVMATPALRAVRQRFAKAHITWMGPPGAREVLSGLTWADELADDPARRANAASVWQAARRVRQGRYDLAVVLPNSFRSALACRLGRARRRAGYARDGRGWLLTDRLAAARNPAGGFAPVPAITYYLDLVASLDCPAVERTMALAVEPRFAREADRLLEQAGAGGAPLVIVNPGSSFGSSKLWPVDRFAAVADELHERHGAAIAINAGPAERAIAAAMEAAMRHRPAVNMARQSPSLGLLKALTARARLMITGDTGPRHIAAALGAAVVTIFGPTDPAWTVIDYPAERIVRLELECSPCRQKRCLLGGPRHHQCMKDISPEMVLSSAEELLREPPSRPGRGVDAPAGGEGGV